MIEWSLYGWNAGEIEQTVIQGNVQEIGLNNVEVNTQLSVPTFDYYLLVGYNKIRETNGGFIRLFVSESRFSNIAPMNGIWERTGEVTSSSAILHTYLTEKPPFSATEPDTLRVPPMAGYAQFSVYRDPGLQDLVAQSGFYPVDDYIQIDDGWRRINYNFRWSVSDLQADTEYYYTVETRSSDGSEQSIF